MAKRTSKTTPTGRKKVGKPRLEPVAVSAALVRHVGNISAVARQFKVTRQSVQGLIAAHPALKDVLADAREQMKDDAESALMKAVRQGASWAVLFCLKTQAQDRGYGDKPRIEHTGGGQRKVTEVVVRSRVEAAAILALNAAGRAGSGPWPVVDPTAHSSRELDARPPTAHCDPSTANALPAAVPDAD